MRKMSEADIRVHDGLFQIAWTLMERVVYWEGTRPRRLGLFSRWRLRAAQNDFKRVLELNPENHAAMFALGKISQRRGDYQDALNWFEQAMRLQARNSDYAREAGLTALMAGCGDVGLKHCKRALSLSASDASLKSNLAAAHLVSGDAKRALAAAQEVCKCDPSDQLAKLVVSRATDAIQDNRSHPRSFFEIL